MQTSLVTAPQTVAPDRQRLMDTARELEAAFLSEMLSHAGFSQSSEAFGGGAGEEQFASFLRAEQAKLIVDRGGLGLAEMIFKSMTKAGGQVDDV